MHATRPLGRADDPATEIAGLPFDALDESGVIQTILDSLSVGRGGWLVNPNVDVLRQVVADPKIAALTRSATLVVADGVPLLWAARLMGRPLPGLVAGSDLILSLSKAAYEAGTTVFLLGGAPGVAATAAQAMSKVVGSLPSHHSPPFGFEDDAAELDVIRRQLQAAQPGIVFCGFGFPKQERLMSLLAPEFPSTWFIGTGASISFLAGDTPRAPRLLRGSGFEWAFRLLTEPRRLFRRYIVLDAPFACRLLVGAFLRGRRARGAQAATSTSH